jgi:hypothetical protein
MKLVMGSIEQCNLILSETRKCRFMGLGKLSWGGGKIGDGSEGLLTKFCLKLFTNIVT